MCHRPLLASHLAHNTVRTRNTSLPAATWCTASVTGGARSRERPWRAGGPRLSGLPLPRAPRHAQSTTQNGAACRRAPPSRLLRCSARRWDSFFGVLHPCGGAPDRLSVRPEQAAGDSERHMAWPNAARGARPDAARAGDKRARRRSHNRCAFHFISTCSPDALPQSTFTA